MHECTNLTPVRNGAGLGLFLTVPLTAIWGAASTVAGIRFPPFDLFDWLARVLPGHLMTFGIETLVRALDALGLSLRATSKSTEKGFAVLLFLAGGTIVGTALGASFCARKTNHPIRRSIAVSVAAGILVAVGVATSPTVTGADVGAAVVWVLGTFVGWGALFGFLWRQLASADGNGLNVEDRDDGRRAPAHARQGTSLTVQPTDDRRQFLLRVGGAAAVVTVAGATIARVLRPSLSTDGYAGRAPQRPIRPGEFIPASGTRREVTPVKDHYRVDINLIPPAIDGRAWNLPISGLVEKSSRLTLDGFEAGQYGPPQDLSVTLECISNPLGGDLISTTKWTGVPLRTVLKPLGLKPSARFAVIRSADGFHESVPLDLAMADSRVMLTYRWDGAPLPRKHGFPLRIYIPGRYGMKQPKWMTSIDVVESDKPGFWVERGWSATALVKTTSVIDTVAVNSVYEKDGRRFVPIGGIAYAGARGISRVELRVDDGPWTAATIGHPLSGLTWVLWRYDWPFESGSHTFGVRSVDGFGEPQITTVQPSLPEGATGIYRVKKRL